jgi:ribA/ribD-fused uncharacterized protein
MSITKAHIGGDNGTMSEPALIRKVADDYGCLGNMSPHPVEKDGYKFRTTEALFQCLRFTDMDIINEIRKQRSPMAAKMVAKKNHDKMWIEPMGKQDILNMKMCLLLKVRTHEVVRLELMGTGDRPIIEDCSKRRSASGLFWGAAWNGKEWEGQNMLGVLWMEIREQLRHE